ncbi:MarR family transcriptional regulator [Weissella koreensis]|uniref:MarR family winged helix-turn-helix transcriptional regulator n=1 Tax=Weissella koreensis TaxID=165096 RepID=UPI0022BA43C9|nr:MarR family transcriptional regulator [Weissella koreensis]MCZ9311408.1 MarR family transcriptional regulator [Weissella koreensis]
MMLNDIGGKIKAASLLTDREFTRRLENKKLSATQLRFLKFIVLNRNNNLTTKEIERASLQGHATVSGVLRRLIRDGYAIETVNIDDRREKFIEPTETGTQIVTANDKYLEIIDNMMLKDVSEEELVLLNRVLDKIVTNLSNEI